MAKQVDLKRRRQRQRGRIGLINTLRPRKMAAISQTMFSNAFSWMKIFEFCSRFHWRLFLNIPSLVQIMAWRRPADKPLSEPMMVSLLTHICGAWPQWVINDIEQNGQIATLSILTTTYYQERHIQILVWSGCCLLNCIHWVWNELFRFGTIIIVKHSRQYNLISCSSFCEING